MTSHIVLEHIQPMAFLGWRFCIGPMLHINHIQSKSMLSIDFVFIIVYTHEADARHRLHVLSHAFSGPVSSEVDA